ncbi:hypothetical protein D3C72_2563950 [compost metagenome]
MRGLVPGWMPDRMALPIRSIMKPESLRATSVKARVRTSGRPLVRIHSEVASQARSRN